MRQLTVFRSRAGDDTAMRIVAIHSTFSDARNIAAVADYLSDLDANPRPVIGSGDHLPVGQELYEHICAACHGDDGQGRPGNGAPRIGGQHYPYLRRQIELASEFHKEVAPPEMTTAIRSLRTPEKDALADYISRLARCKHGDSTRSMPPTAPEGSSLGDALDLQGVSTAAPSKRPARRSSSA
jgi:cytochrome c553